MQTNGVNFFRTRPGAYNNGPYAVIGGENSARNFRIVFSWKKKAFFYSTTATRAHKSPALIGVQQPSNNCRDHGRIYTRQTGPQCDVWKPALLFLIFRVLKTLLLLLFSVLFCFRRVFHRILRVAHAVFPRQEQCDTTILAAQHTPPGDEQRIFIYLFIYLGDLEWKPLGFGRHNRDGRRR